MTTGWLSEWASFRSRQCLLVGRPRPWKARYIYVTVSLERQWVELPTVGPGDRAIRDDDNATIPIHTLELTAMMQRSCKICR